MFSKHHPDVLPHQNLLMHHSEKSIETGIQRVFPTDFCSQISIRSGWAKVIQDSSKVIQDSSIHHDLMEFVLSMVKLKLSDII